MGWRSPTTPRASWLWPPTRSGTGGGGGARRSRHQDRHRAAGRFCAGGRGARSASVFAGGAGAGALDGCQRSWRSARLSRRGGPGGLHAAGRGGARVSVRRRTGGSAEDQGDLCAAGRWLLVGRSAPRPDRRRHRGNPGDRARRSRSRALRCRGVDRPSFGSGARRWSSIGSSPAAEIGLPADMPEALAPVGAVVRAQQLARSLSLRMGFDPDAPAGLSKVTPRERVTAT